MRVIRRLRSHSVLGATLLSVAASAVVAAPASAAQTRDVSAVAGHVYLNDNTAGTNTIAAFDRHADGSLTPLAGSPFNAGGAGSGAGLASQGAIQTAGEAWQNGKKVGPGLARRASYFGEQYGRVRTTTYKNGTHPPTGVGASPVRYGGIDQAMGTAAGMIFMSRKKYDGLPADVKATLDRNSGEATSRAWGKWWDGDNNHNREAAKADPKQTVVTLDPELEPLAETAGAA